MILHSISLDEDTEAESELSESSELLPSGRSGVKSIRDASGEGYRDASGEGSINSSSQTAKDILKDELKFKGKTEI